MSKIELPENALKVAETAEVEQISISRHPSGAWAIIVVHDTTLGPALGGCRLRKYPTLALATRDAIGLAEGMTFKSALADLPLGGGKAVLLEDRNLVDGRVELFQWFAERVNEFGGRYVTAEDMGTRVSDIEVVKERCQHVTGVDSKNGGGGDPSPWTALGVFQGMRASLERVYGSDDFSGRTVAIQGVGNVGRFLLDHLSKAGARVVVADTRKTELEELGRKYEFQVASVDEILTMECDILSPCAVSHVLSEELIPKLRCRIIAGAANTQLEARSVEKDIAAKNVLYAPDFAINSGGVILCADEREEGGYLESRVRERVLRIYETTKKVFEQADSSNMLPGEAALFLAKQKIENAKSK